LTFFHILATKCNRDIINLIKSIEYLTNNFKDIYIDGKMELSKRELNKFRNDVNQIILANNPIEQRREGDGEEIVEVEGDGEEKVEGDGEEKVEGEGEGLQQRRDGDGRQPPVQVERSIIVEQIIMPEYTEKLNKQLLKGQYRQPSDIGDDVKTMLAVDNKKAEHNLLVRKIIESINIFKTFKHKTKTIHTT
jgi:hypothetical protein